MCLTESSKLTDSQLDLAAVTNPVVLCDTLPSSEFKQKGFREFTRMSRALACPYGMQSRRQSAGVILGGMRTASQSTSARKSRRRTIFQAIRKSAQEISSGCEGFQFRGQWP